MEVKELRIEAKLKNNRLYQLIYNNYTNVSEFCRINGFSKATVGQLLRLTKTPVSTKDGEYLQSSKDIANHFNVSALYLFPLDIYMISTTRAIGEITYSEGLSLSHEGKYLNYDDSEMIDSVNNNLLADKINKVLHTLPPREQEVLEMRFGLNRNSSLSLRETGLYFGVTGQRIRQIEAKAMRRLRHPKRSEMLEQYVS